MTMLASNPYTWGYIEQQTITSAVPSLSFLHSDGSPLSVSSLPVPIEIVMFEGGNQTSTYSIGNNSLINSPDYDPQEGANFDTWTLPKGTTKKLVLNTENGTTGTSALQVRVIFMIYSDPCQ